MIRVFRLLLTAILLTVLVVAALWLLVPRTGIDITPRFDPTVMGDDIPAWLARREGVFDDITPGAEKRIIWASEAGAHTEWAVIYLHGFSATSEETRPLSDLVAQELGANLFYTRLAGHGRDGAAMGAATGEDWVLDLDEALAIGRRIGDRILIISTSTGGTLATIAATDPNRAQGVAGMVLMSPNYRLADRMAQVLLDGPYVEYWGALVAGKEHSFTPRSPEQARWWTTSYPIQALYTLAALMRATRALDPADATVPALFVWSGRDLVVDEAATAKVAAAWGAPAKTLQLALTPQDDPHGHVIAGRILSPDQTEPVAQAILDWVGSL